MYRKRRVVITGVGAVAPKAIGVEQFWSNLILGHSAIDYIKSFDVSTLKCKIGGEVGKIDTSEYFDSSIKINRYGKNALFGLVSSVMALRSSRLELDGKLRANLSLVMGVTGGPLDIMMKHVPRSSPSPLFIPAGTANSVCTVISEYFGLHARSLTTSTACAAGLDAMGIAYQRIRSGEEEIILAGGSDSTIAFHPFADLEACGMLTDRNDPPEKASRPFDLKRDRGLASEGAGVCIFEELKHAKARKAPIYAEVIGCRSNLDPHDGEHGSGLVESMQGAMDDGSISTHRVQYINAHGPSDRNMDRVESDAIKKVFGQHARKVMISSIKGVTGNPFAAGGALQMVASALTIDRKMVHPTANYEIPDPICDLDFVPGAARKVSIDTMLVNSHGMGGGNCTIALARFKE
ncbi:3-oxoacyl-[acyl-carrier-protein] synthase II [Verrucomicrobium sp. GAS474]|uniref:beta-ketoacyl-[acyl-carrier-protein] synthase family protein n=1 Tax=Verrucomicrobium sp. GAS474 TaxID=1882831 RepID=UPI00087CEF45|nr:beta-ketoacyl-[acyl-carrier-protein] synthase family protein [Verrucomicrobium sp. GAS474]SDT93156.1 3-oxoacyl-[acyl-carrier-protein] synthase II [Verrucomicrobium sp. GAS474]